jgi:Transposase DDE domain group 1
MEQYTGFSAHASLATLGLWMKEHQIWQQIEQQVTIKQKTIRYTPHEKLKDAFINILAGGHGIVEVNQRVRTDKALQFAFGRKACAEQSVVSETLNACTEMNARQMEEVARTIYQEFGQGYRHDYEQAALLLDVDFTGLLAGRQAEGASKGYFSGTKNGRGRQLGRVMASQYEEIVYEQLYEGKVQLEKGLIGLLEMSENVLDLNETRRQRTIVRVDAGGGTDKNINWALQRGYFWMSKIKNWQRTCKLVAPITDWQTLPELPGHEMAWVPEPHPYEKPMRQLAVRWPKPKGGWQYCVLVFNLTDDMLFDLAERKHPAAYTEPELFSAILKAYNLRGGGVETSFRNSKQGLGFNKRNKKSFQAQRILIVLARLAYNITVWVRTELAKHKPELQHYGMLRMLRDAFSIPGKLHFDANGCLDQVVLNKTHSLSITFYETWLSLFAHNGLLLILDEI